MTSIDNDNALTRKPADVVETSTAVVPSATLEGQWLPAPRPDVVSEEILRGRHLASHDPAGLFQWSGIRSIQALPHNTFRAYRADWCTFVQCCQLHGHAPLPASVASLETFIEWRSPWNKALAERNAYQHCHDPQRRTPASASAVARALSAISAVHVWLRMPDLTGDPDVRATLKINCEWRKTQRPKQPLRWADIERACALMGDDLRSVRNKAMIALAHSTMLRRSELVALHREHYSRATDSEVGEVQITKTKAGTERHTKYRHVRAEAAAHLETWLVAANLTTGPIFCGVDPGGRLRKQALDAGEVARIFKAIGALIGEPAARIGGHSTRIGAAHDLAEFGAQLPEIMTEGGWTSPQMPSVYLRERNAGQGAMARMAKAQRSK